MKPKHLFIAAAVASIVTGATLGFAFADDQDRDQGTDQSTNSPGYSDHWFSSTGYGPNDDQAEATRALNREQMGHHGGVVNEDRRDRDDRDMQGPSDNDASPPPEREEPMPPPPPSDYR